MAIVQTQCTVFKVNLLKGTENFNVGSPYTYKIALYTASANLNADTLAYTTTDEITGTGYAAGGEDLTPTVPSSGSGTAFVSFADVTWDPASFTTRGALIYNGTTGAAVAVLNFGSDKTATNTFTVTFPTADASNAILRISQEFIMMKEKQGFGDNAVATLQANAIIPEGMGVEGFYQVECRDAAGNLKWEEEFPNLVVAVGKELLLNTLLTTSGTYTTVGPFLGLINNSTTFAAADTMTSKTWTELTTYTVGGSAVRGTAVFAAASSSGLTPSNISTSAATAITYTMTGSATVYGCFLVTGTGAVSTLSSTAGVLYSEGNFATAKTVTSGDTVSVTYSTTATS